MIHWLASANRFVHVCGHRGHSIATPENTLAALRATRDAGGTTAEIDVVLTADDEIILLHDQSVDRTSNGSGLAGAMTLEAIRALDAGSWFAADFAGEPIPTLHEAIRFAREIGLGLVVEIKERRRVDRLLQRLGEVLAETGGIDQVIVISFDHKVLLRAKAIVPALKTEGITHAAHADIVHVARSARLDSVSIEHLMFRPDDAEALHAAGVAIRLHLQAPRWFERQEQFGIDHRPEIGRWLRAGLVDSLSGDDVAYLARLVADNPLG
jgi:glycerophosphoryl diester phosphodiesterase